MFNWIKAIVLWCFVKKNREIAIRYVKIGLDVASRVSKLTKSKKDDLGVEYVAKKFKIAARNLDSEATEKVAKDINEAKGSLSNLKLGYDSKDGKIKAAIGLASVDWNPANGQIKFGVSL